MSTTTLASTRDAAMPAPLTNADRCDRCGAQAFVRAVMLTGADLVFCAHHGRAYDAALRAVAVLVVDESARTNAKPSVSANAD